MEKARKYSSLANVHGPGQGPIPVPGVCLWRQERQSDGQIGPADCGGLRNLDYEGSTISGKPDRDNPCGRIWLADGGCRSLALAQNNGSGCEISRLWAEMLAVIANFLHFLGASAEMSVLALHGERVLGIHPVVVQLRASE